MTTEASPTDGRGPTTHRRTRPTSTSVPSLRPGSCLTAAAIRLDGIVIDATFGVLLLLALLSWWFGLGRGRRRARLRLSLTGIVMLAAMALVGPAGAGIVGTLLGPLRQRASPAAGAHLQQRDVRDDGRRRRSRLRRRGWPPRRAAGRPGTWEIVLQHRDPGARRRHRAVRRQHGAASPSSSGSRRASRCARRSARSLRSSGSGTDRLRRHRVHHGRALGAGGPGLGERVPHPPPAARRPVGLPAVRRGGQGRTTVPCTCWWPRSRPRLRTWSATAPEWPS